MVKARDERSPSAIDERISNRKHGVSLQVDGGQHTGVFERMVFTVKHGGGSFELCRLLVTAVANAAGPKLNGALMTSHTEYWLIRLDAWSALQQLLADPSAHPKLEVAIGPSEQKSDATVADGETVFTAQESSTWASTTATEWPDGVFGFGATQPGTLRGIAFESAQTGGENAVWWAQKGDVILPVSDVADHTFARATPTDNAVTFSCSMLVPWAG
jgi:hypothetical protein